jgi:hypothetical protein
MNTKQARIDGLKAKIASWTFSVERWTERTKGPAADATDEAMLARAERRLAETREELACLCPITFGTFEEIRVFGLPMVNRALANRVRIFDDAAKRVQS